MALRVSELCFWPAKTRKNLELFVMHTYLWPGAQIWFRHKWRKLVAASLLLHFFDWNSCLHYFRSFFSPMIQVLDGCFLVLHFDGNVCKWIPKVIWPQMDSFWIFFSKNGVFCWLHICFDWNLQELFNCLSFLRTSKVFDLSFQRYLVCSLKMLVLFSHRIL